MDNHDVNVDSNSVNNSTQGVTPQPSSSAQTPSINNPLAGFVSQAPAQDVASTGTPTAEPAPTNSNPTPNPISNANSTITASEVQPASPSVPPPVPPVTDGNDSSSQHAASGKGPNMILLSLIVLFVGVISGIALYTTGIFRNNTLRLGDYDTKEPTGGVLMEKEKITVGTDATYPPMEYYDAQGNLVGYDIDLASKLSEEMGTDFEFKNISFDKIFDALENKEIEVIISSVTITDERKLKYNFSEPYINAGQVVVTARDFPESQITPDKLAGKRIGVQKGTTSEEEAIKYVGSGLVKTFADYPEAVTALNNKLIDAIIVDLTAAKGLVDENPNLRISSDPFTNEYYGIVLRKGDVKLKTDIDKAILSLQKRGLLDNIKQKWFQ